MKMHRKDFKRLQLLQSLFFVEYCRKKAKSSLNKIFFKNNKNILMGTIDKIGNLWQNLKVTTD